MAIEALRRPIATILAAAFMVASDASPSLSQQPPPFYGVYVLTNGQLLEIPEAFVERGPGDRIADQSTPGDGSIIHDRAQIYVKPGRLSFVVYDRAVALGSPHDAFVYIVPRIRAFVDRTVTPERRVNPETLQSLEFQRASRYRGSYWTVLRTGYPLRSGPYGTASDMVLYRSPTPSFEFPPGRYRLRLGFHNYDFNVVREPNTSGTPPCVDAIEYLDPHGDRQPKFEGCGPGGQAPPSGILR